MAGRIISYLKKLFQNNELNSYKIPPFKVRNLQELETVLYVMLSDLRRRKESDQIVQKDTGLKTSDSEDSVTEE